MNGKKQVVIVGGGLAGLAAAETLLRQHADRFHVSIVESKQTPGGRASSFTDRSSGEAVDYCQHVSMGCCTNFIDLMRRCGLSESFQRYTELKFLHPKYPHSNFSPISWLPAPLHLATAVGSLNHLTWSQQRTVRRGLLRLMRTSTTELARSTAAEWLSRIGQDAATIRDFWDVILTSALGETTAVVSMSAARKVMVDGFAGARGASDVLVPRQPLQQLFGVQLSRTVEQLGGQIHTQSPVQSVSDDPIGVQVSAGDFLTASHVISAVPWHQVARTLGPQVAGQIDNLPAISNFPSSPITDLHLWFDRELTEFPHAVMVGTLAQWLFRDPIGHDEQDRPQGHYYQVVISASREATSISKDALITRVLSELRRAFPANSSANLIASRIVTDPRAVFSVTPEVERLRPPARTPLPWLHLAGDWIATGWPATMEGAVISGIMAANSVLQTEELALTTIDPGLPRGRLAKFLIKS